MVRCPVRPALLLLWLSLPPGCETGPAPIADPSPIPRVDAEVGAPFVLTIEPRLATLPPLGRSLTLHARDLDTEEFVVEQLPPVLAWPLVVPLTSLQRGRWALTVFIDRDGDQRFDDCPFPPRPTDTEALEAVDSFSGGALVRVAPGGAASVQVEQRICGPGDRETGLRGEIAPPDGAQIAGPIGLILEPLPDATRVGDPPPPVRLSLRRGALGEPLPFEIGELVPGRYAVTAFADADGDATPSPCSQGIGGGDRFVSAARTVTVAAAQRVSVGEPLVLAPADCPEALTGLTGSVTLAPGLPADPGFDGPLGPLSGQIHLAWFPSASFESVAKAPILSQIDARPLPHRFTVTGVPPGLWRMVAWIDRDRDGSFTPCGGLTGIDATWTQIEDVLVVDGEVREAAAPVVLSRHACDAAAETGLTGTLEVDVEPGAVGSGRPVRAELISLSGEAQRSLKLADNHTALPPDGRFIAAGLPPGRYDVLLYVDTDRDGRLISCRQAEYADRAIARRDAVTIEAGRITALGAVRIQAEGCDPPRAEIRPQFNFSARIPDDTVADLRLIIQERGGWRMERRLRTRVSPSVGTLFTETIDLAPGEFRVTAWLDTNGNGRFDDCGAESEDAVVARLDLTLDEGAAVRSPIFEMDLACGR